MLRELILTCMSVFVDDIVERPIQVPICLVLLTFSYYCQQQFKLYAEDPLNSTGGTLKHCCDDHPSLLRNEQDLVTELIFANLYFVCYWSWKLSEKLLDAHSQRSSQKLRSGLLAARVAAPRRTIKRMPKDLSTLIHPWTVNAYSF